MLLLQQLKSYRWATNPSGVPTTRESGKSRERSLKKSPRHHPHSSRTRSRSRSVSPCECNDEDPRATAVRVADELLKPAFELQYRYKDKEKALADAGFDPDSVPTRSHSPTRAKSPAVAMTTSSVFNRPPVITTTAIPIRSVTPEVSPLASARPGSPEEKRLRAKAMLAESVEKFKAAARTVQQSFEVLQATEDEVMASEAANIAHQVSAVERETAAKLSGRGPVTTSRTLLPSKDALLNGWYGVEVDTCVSCQARMIHAAQLIDADSAVVATKQIHRRPSIGAAHQDCQSVRVKRRKKSHNLISRHG